MKNQLSLTGKPEDDGSDALSTASNNSGLHFHQSNSLGAGHNDNPDETESIGDGSKRIRKKRNAYQKIDDDVRLKLLEAVQKNGETLKSAAKKYKINYSSAKSILHTFRKEGRILKKSAQERNIKRNPNGQGGEDGSDEEFDDRDMEDQENVNQEQKARLNSDDVKAEKYEAENEMKENIGDTNNMNDTGFRRIKPSGAGNVLGENSFTSILKGSNGANNSRNLGAPKPKLHTPKASNKPLPKLTQLEPKDMHEETSSENLSFGGDLGFNLSSLVGMPNLATLAQFLQGSSADKLSMLQKLYNNYSQTPLTNLAPVQEKTDSKENLNKEAEPEVEKETEMAIEKESEKKSEEKEKQTEEIAMPHPLRFNTAQLLQEKVESQLNNNEDVDWNETIENAAIDTFKSFMDAQLLLCDALKKASYLNSLMQIQKERNNQESPSNNQSQGVRQL